MSDVKNKIVVMKHASHVSKGLAIMKRVECRVFRTNQTEYKIGRKQYNNGMIMTWHHAEAMDRLGKSEFTLDCNIRDNDRYIIKKHAVKKEISIEEKFNVAARNWKKETSVYSFVSRKITNSNYVNIIGLGVVYGEPVIKIILEDLKKGTEFWHYALKKITNDNPVSKGDVNNLQKVREAWLAWGVKKNLI